MRGMKNCFPQSICTRMFIAMFFIIVKTWVQMKCPSIGEWINELWYIFYNGIQHSNEKGLIHCMRNIVS